MILTDCFKAGRGHHASPRPSRRGGRHRKHCSCKGKPGAAYPGDQWRCPACSKVYVAEIYSGRIVWLFRPFTPTYKIPKRKSS